MIMLHERTRLPAGIRVTTFWTMVSRILGMVRDVATAALFGLVGSGAIDAFVIAFRIPNLFRRLFGEGALAGSYLPVLTETLEQSRGAAWQLVSVLLGWLTIVLSAFVLLSELFCAVVWAYADHDSQLQLIAGLSAIMLPYLLFVCLAAQISATLHALNHFSTPAVAPILLNVCWIAAALWIAPGWSENPAQQAYVLAGAVLIGGLLQFGMQFPVLRQFGFRFDFQWKATRQAVRRVTTGLLPTLLGLAIAQINTLVDTFVGWIFSAPTAETTIPWLGHSLMYPLREGVIAAIYFSERIYQLPIGLLGVAVGTVIFPALSRHAFRGNQIEFGNTLTLGLRVTLFLAIPASVGLILLGQPLTVLLFRHGEFTATDALRTAEMVIAYGSGVWAYCALPILARGFYAYGDRHTPWRLGGYIVLLNFVLDLVLIWRFAEVGLALASALVAGLLMILLCVAFSRRITPLHWQSIKATVVRSSFSAFCMFFAGWAILQALPKIETAGLWQEVLRVIVPLICCVIVYWVVSAATGGTEWRALAGREQGKHL